MEAEGVEKNGGLRILECQGELETSRSEEVSAQRVEIW